MAKQTTITVETSSLLILQGRISRRAWCPQCAAEEDMIAVENTRAISNLDRRRTRTMAHLGGIASDQRH